jgi:hypothetical protein
MAEQQDPLSGAASLRSCLLAVLLALLWAAVAGTCAGGTVWALGRWARG